MESKYLENEQAFDTLRKLTDAYLEIQMNRQRQKKTQDEPGWKKQGYKDEEDLVGAYKGYLKRVKKKVYEVIDLNNRLHRSILSRFLFFLRIRKKEPAEEVAQKYGYANSKEIEKLYNTYKSYWAIWQRHIQELTR